MTLRDFLRENGLGKSQFARQIGVSFQTVYRYMDGTRVPRRDVLLRISKVTRGAVMPNDFHQFSAHAGSSTPPRENRP